MLRLQTSSQALRKGNLIGLLWIMGLTAASAQSPTITQSTQGWCSPAVGQARGNVTIVCQGVNPKALDRLNELLDKKDLELRAKIQEAEAWAQKYRDLQERLTQEGRNDVLAQTAKALLEEGKLDEAGAILDRLLASGERTVEQVASDHFNRAEVYALQFQPYNALPHYEKAYRYRPNNAKYAFQYAFTLQKQNHHTKAQVVYNEALGIIRRLAEANPQVYLPDVATTLNNLGNLYRDMHRPSESEQALQEALGIRRKLAEANPQAHLSYVATTLNNLGVLYGTTQRPSDGEQAYQEALGIRRKLAQANPQVYLPDVATTLNNLGNLYSAAQRLSDGEQAYQEALGIRRKLAEANPQTYLPDVANTLNNLAILKFTQNHMKQAQVLVSEALTIRRGLWKKHAAAYGDDFAKSLAVEAMVLLRMEKEASLVCGRLHEMRNVAVSEGLKQWANERAKGLCDKTDDKTIRKQ